MAARIIRGTDPGLIQLEGEIDMPVARDLRSALDDVIAGGGRATVDMSLVTFIDSTGLHALHRAALHPDGNGPLILVDVPPRVLRIMEIIGMDRLPQIELRSRVGG